ncbi:MAG: helix-turn-helix domain-containing protein [Caldilineaceae bacterium]
MGVGRKALVLSVMKALQLLETLASAASGLALGDLSRRNDLHPSTAHRLLHTWPGRIRARQDPTDRNYHRQAR